MIERSPIWGARRMPSFDERFLMLPLLLTFALFFLVPLVLLFVTSLTGPTLLASYYKFFASAAAMKILRNTVLIASVVTVSCVLIAVPFALALKRLPRQFARAALLCTTLPMWMSVLVRSYAWLYLLAQEGLINSALLAIGLTDTPLPLLFNWGAVSIGMVHIMLPYMLLPVYNAVEALDQQLLNAARSLGASPARIFLTIVLPLISRGIMTGSILVFVIALGFYVTPQMLGGPRDMMLAVYIDAMVNVTLDWPLAAAASVVLVLSVFVGYGLSLLADRHKGTVVR